VSVNSGWKLTRTPGFAWIDPENLTIPPTGDWDQQGLLSRTRCFDYDRRQQAIADWIAMGNTVPNKLSKCPDPNKTSTPKPPSPPAPPGPPPPPPPPPPGGGA
jgi:hypothetical protein